MITPMNTWEYMEDLHAARQEGEQRRATTMEDRRRELLEAADEGREEGYRDGYAAGLAAQPPADVHVPVPVRWRAVRPGDVLLGEDGELYAVVASWLRDGVCTLGLRHGEWSGWPHGDPDQTARVLIPAALKDALTLTRDELGARLVATREEGS